MKSLFRAMLALASISVGVTIIKKGVESSMDIVLLSAAGIGFILWLYLLYSALKKED